MPNIINNQILYLINHNLVMHHLPMEYLPLKFNKIGSDSGYAYIQITKEEYLVLKLKFNIEVYEHKFFLFWSSYTKRKLNDGYTKIIEIRYPYIASFEFAGAVAELRT